MAAMEAIRLPAMLFLSALLAVLVVRAVVSGAWSAAGLALAHGPGRRHAQRHGAWSVARGHPPRTLRFERRGTSSRN